METLVGSTLGGYTLTRVIGSGGMGTVYLAEDKAIGQQVAIKVVRTEDSEYADIMSKGQVAERFRQEARAVASLDHLNILPLYRYGEEETSDGMRSYMVMQYRSEGSLWGWLRKRAEQVAQIGATTSDTVELPSGLPTGWPLPKEEVADYLNQAAAALQYAHDRGFIHRDVKPENFLLRFDKNPADNKYKVFLLLSDFGLAKFFSNLSGTSQILGTPTYMAPEQFSGNAGPESDQYALAIMVYCLLAGQPPFNGDPIYLMHQHLTAEPPSIRIFAPRLSAKIEAVLDKALAKLPSKRYPSITEFADAFTQSIYAEQKTANAIPTARPPFSLPAQAQQPKDLPHKASNELFLAQMYNAPEAQYERPSNISTTNHPVQAQSNRNSQLDNFIFDVDPVGKSYQQLQEPPTVIAKPGQRSDTKIQKQSSSGSNQQNGQTNKGVITRRNISKWIIIGGVAAVGIGAGTAGIYLTSNKSRAQAGPGITQQTSHSTTLPTTQRTTPNIKHILRGHEQAISSLDWSPDGSKLASGSLDRSVRLWNLDRLNDPLIIKKHKLGVITITWQPDNAQLAAGGKDNSIQIYNATDGSLQQTYTTNDGVGVISKIAWSQDGQDLFVSTLGDGLERITLDDHNVDQKGTRATFRSLALSPDGQYMALGNDTGFIAILALPNLRRLLVSRIHKGSIRALAWSPDSTLLASASLDKTIQIIDRNTQNIISSSIHNSIINDIAWQPENPQKTQAARKLAIALTDSTMQIWTIGNNTHTIYKGHTQAVTSVSWGKQGLATGSLDKTIIIWNV